jgi:hypothetical protein
MKVILSLPKILLFAGWLLFWWSLSLPFNTSLGGITDAGRPFYGELNLFYSIVALFIIPEAVTSGDGLFIIPLAGVGICNLAMIFSPAIWFVNFKNKFLAKYLMAVCAVYACLIGSMLSYHFYPVRYGHYIWCLSFITVAYAFALKIIYKDAFS